MRRVSALLVTVCLLLLGGSPAAGQVLPIPAQPDRSLEMQRYTAEALRDAVKMFGDWSSAWRAGDVRSTARYYSDDATLRTADGTVFTGRDEIGQHLEAVVRPGGDMHLAPSDFAASGSLGYALGRFSFRPTAAPRGARAGTFVAVLLRDGRSWRFRSLVFIADDPGRATSESPRLQISMKRAASRGPVPSSSCLKKTYASDHCCAQIHAAHCSSSPSS